MGISIAICELDAKDALCRDMKKDVQKVKLNDTAGFEAGAEKEDYVTLDDAKRTFPDWEAFLKRNRISEDTDAIYAEKVKNSDDIAKLKAVMKTRATGWVIINKFDDATKAKAIAASAPENRVTGWDMLDFDGMNATCGKCPLSWDKGRGCIGAFGPDNSALPEIAGRRNCPIVASAPVGAKSHRIYTPAEAAQLEKEVAILTAALPEEGKVYVRRYEGVLERLLAVAKISQQQNCGFYFF